MKDIPHHAQNATLLYLGNGQPVACPDYHIVGQRAEQRQQLTLQIDLLAEQEATKTLQLLERICQRLGIQEIAQDASIQILAKETAVDQLADDLKDHLPEQ